jgi:hypothetical protein
MVQSNLKQKIQIIGKYIEGKNITREVTVHQMKSHLLIQLQNTYHTQ